MTKFWTMSILTAQIKAQNSLAPSFNHKWSWTPEIWNRKAISYTEMCFSLGQGETFLPTLQWDWGHSYLELAEIPNVMCTSHICKRLPWIVAFSKHLPWLNRVIFNHEGTRTLNLLIRSQTPCPLGHVVLCIQAKVHVRPRREPSFGHRSRIIG